MNAAIKSASSAVEPSKKFTIINLLSIKFYNPSVFKQIFNYEVRFNILNPEWAFVEIESNYLNFKYKSRFIFLNLLINSFNIGVNVTTEFGKDFNNG